MASREKYTHKPQSEKPGIPFESAEEAWFWFIVAQAALVDGARFIAGNGLIPRPCEPVDILKIMDRLYRQRRLLRDHLLVLKHYGQRHLPPDPRRPKEMRAHTLWSEALERMELVMIRKGIVRNPGLQPCENWSQRAFVFEGAAE